MGSDNTVINDSGRLFLGPHDIEGGKALSNGKTVQWFRQAGYSLDNSSESPLSASSVYVIGTVVKDEAGGRQLSVEVLQFIDPDGDILWLTGYNEGKPGHNTYILRSGTGKWKYMRGELSQKGFIRKRSDGHMFIAYDMTYRLDEYCRDQETYDSNKDKYTVYDRGWSFHGPHINEFKMPLNNGYTLIVNNQTGVLMSENENSPRHNAVGYDRGIGIAQAGIKDDICHICFIEDTDADGDIAWLFAEFWYGVEPGRYDFIGGTGKWKGIRGKGRDLGLIRMRADDWWMLNWEMSWNV